MRVLTTQTVKLHGQTADEYPGRDVVKRQLPKRVERSNRVTDAQEMLHHQLRWWKRIHALCRISYRDHDLLGRITR